MTTLNIQNYFNDVKEEVDVFEESCEDIEAFKKDLEEIAASDTPLLKSQPDSSAELSIEGQANITASKSSQDEGQAKITASKSSQEAGGSGQNNSR